MKTLSNFSEQQLTIVQPSLFKRVYELRSSNECLATLRFPKLFSRGAEVEGFDGNWEFYFPSFWRREVAIRQQGYSLPTAKFVANRWGGGGTIELPQGTRLKYVFKILKNSNDITTALGVPLVSLHQKYFSLKKTDVFIKSHSDELDKYPWVIMLVWYVMLRKQRRQ
ncbi:MAG: hypothetical protein PHP42_11090 [Bacteroidota bacterium]|nr:hypothetical protein [Bacteroidota bacterium]